MNDASRLTARIAEALEQPTGVPTEIAALIRDVEAALGAHERELVELEAQVLDPKTLDGELPGLEALAAAQRLRGKRLATALDRLRALHEAALQRQREQERLAHRRRVEAERDAVAVDLRRDYPALAERIAALLARVAESEAACRALNLPGPEAVARGVSAHNVHWLCGGTILPSFDVGQHRSGQGYWPPSRPRPAPVTSDMARQSEALGHQIRETSLAVSRKRAEDEGSATRRVAS